MEENIVPKKESKFGVGFYIVLVFAVIKDITDVLFDLTIVLSWIPVLTAIPMQMIIFAYFYFVGVSMNGRKLAASAVSSIIEILPFVGFLPTATINLILVRAMDGVVDKLPNVPFVKK